MAHCLFFTMLKHCRLLRICPGRYFADKNLWINVVYILHTFCTVPTIGADGQMIPVELKMKDRGVVT